MKTSWKNEDDIRNKDDPKNIDELKDEDILILKTVPSQSLHNHSFACLYLINFAQIQGLGT